MTVLPKFEVLEDRIVLSGADPDVTFTTTDPDEIIDLGEQDVGFTLTFDNVGTDSGYAPYAEIIIPTSGGDGEGDGPTFDSASFLGSPIVTYELTFDAAGEVEHPFLLDAAGDPLIVTGGVLGDTLVVLELPYGSFSPGNPAVDIDVIIDFSSDGDLNSSPTFDVTAGFALGCDALDNPDDDAPVREAQGSTTVEPRLFEISKTNTGPEFEASTGPSYEYQYVITIDVAPGQELSDFTLTDTLPPEIVYQGGLVINGGVVNTTAEPPVGVQVTAPDDQLVILFDEVTDTVTVTFDYYISNDPSDRATPTNDPTTGLDTAVTNGVTGSGTWVPSDPDDATIAVSDTATDVVTASTLSIQKSNAVVSDNQATGATPDDIYEFTLDIQVSDYFTMGDLVVTDILGDGWTFTPGMAEFTVVEEGDNIATTAFGANAVATLDAVTGETTIVFDLSQALIDAGAGDGVLAGDIAGDGTSSGTQTTVTITYQATIANAYTDAGVPGENEISQGDLLTNDVTITADVRDNGDPLTPTGNTIEDFSSSFVPVATGAIDSKVVYAVNGNTTTSPDLVIAAGDTVTFAITYTAPLGSFENFRIVDNLPQLVFDATEITTFSGTASATPPAAGTVSFGAGTTADISGIVPTITSFGPDNQITLDFGDFSLDPRGAQTIEILMTVTVQDAIFAPDLLLTNQATAFEENSFGEEVSSTAIANFTYAEPDLNITKGVLATNGADPDTAIVDGPTGLAGVSVPDGTTPRFTGTVNSDGLALAPVDANIENVNAGDIVTFGVVLENTGAAPNGAFNITVRDTLPDGFLEPVGGFNLSITDGAGTPISFTRTDGTPATAADFFDPAQGLLLVDDAPLEGAISAFDATSGENIIVITYDLLVDSEVSPQTTITNTAGIASYNAFEGNGDPFSSDPDTPVNRVTEPLEDTATATTEEVDITKTLETRQFDGNSFSRSGNEVVIGEDFTFLIRVDIPEGVMFETVIGDAVTVGGLTIYDAEIVTLGAQMTNTGGLSVGDMATVAGNAFSFDFDELRNAGDNDPSNDFIEIRVFARAEDDDIATPGRDEFLRNDASITFENADGDALTETDNANVRIATPNVELAKSASPAIISAGGDVNYTVDITNPVVARDAPAFDLTLSDTLAPELTLTAGSITLFVNNVATPFDGVNYALTTPAGGDANAFEIFIDRLDQGDAIRVEYTGVADDDIAAGLSVPNTADLTFDTTPEDDSGADGDDREFSLDADAEVVTFVPEITKDTVPGSTTYVDTAGDALGIGEEITYEFVLVIPDGSIADVVLTDTLPAGMEYVSSEVVSIGSNLTGSTLSVGASGTNSGGLATTFNFGDLVNAVDANTASTDVNDQIVVRLTARLTADPVVDTNASLTNQGVFSFTSGDGDPASVDDDATITVVEPDVSIAKGVIPANADAGDTVSYTVTVTNDGDGPAYDMIINDDGAGADVSALPGTLLVELFEADGTTTYTPVEATTQSFNAAGELQVIVPDLPPGFIVVITYDATVNDSALFSSNYINTAEVARYDSNPDGDETTGPVDPDLERTYTGPSATADITTPDATLVKAFEGSDNADTSGTNLNVGEEVSYLLTITVPQGTAGITLTDNLPDGLLAQSAEVVSIGDGVNDSSTTLSAGLTDADANITINAARDAVVFNFGTVTIDGSDDTAARDTTIVVRVTSLVDDVTAAAASDPLINTATLAVTDPATGTPLQPPVTASETITVVEPDLTVDKSGEVAGDPGDILDYTITITNDGNGPAYDIDVLDAFANPDLTYIVGSAASVDGGTLTEPAPGQGDGFLFEFDGPLLPGADITITFQGVIEASADTAEAFTNTATVAFDSVAGDPVDADGNPTGRTDTSTGAHTVSTNPSIAKTPFSSNFSETDSATGSTPFSLAIGEEVTFRYEITLPEIDLGSVIATDTLPAGLEFVSASIVDVNGTGAVIGNFTATPDGGDPQLIVLDFGAMNNPSNGSIGADDVLVFDVVARVTDGGAANAGDTLTNSVSLIVDPVGDDAFAPQTATADVFIVEPQMSIAKTGPLALDPGGAAGAFTIVATNDGVAGAEGPAYDVVVSDALPVGMTLDTGSLVFTDGAGTTLTPVSLTATATGFSAEFAVLLPGQSVQADYDATLDAGQPALTTFENTATVVFDSAPGDVLDGLGNPIEQTYAPVTDSHEIASTATLDKAAVGSGFPQTPDNNDGDAVSEVAIGETVTYELVLTLPEIPMDTIVLTDMLPVGLSFVSAEVTEIGAFITVDGSADVATVNTNASFVPSGQDLTITLADVVNADTDETGTRLNDAIVVQITARVEDIAANSGLLPNTQLTNTAGLSITPQGEDAFTAVTDTAVVEVVEPNLTLEKTGNIAVNPGDTVTYQLEIENTGTGPAFDLVIADTFGNPFLSLVPGSVTFSFGGFDETDVTITETGDGFTFEMDDTATGQPIPVGAGETLIITYQAILDGTAPEAQTFINTATVDYDSLPGDPLDENGDPVDDRDYSVDDDYSVATVPFLFKTPIDSSFAETDSTVGSDPFDLAIGETVTYSYDLYLPEIDMDQVLFTDNLPDGMEFVSYNIVFFGTGLTDTDDNALVAPVAVVNGNDITIDFGDVRNPEDTAPPTIGLDDVIRIEVIGLVTSAVSAGETLVNTALLEIDPVGADSLTPAGATADVRVVEPELTIDKTGPIALDPGDIGTFEVVVGNTGPNVVPDATGPAYDVTIEDILPAGMILDPGTIVITLNGAAYTPAAGELTSTPAGFALDFDVLLPDDEVVITYDVQLSPAADALAVFLNTVTAAYDSAPGNNPAQEVYTPASDTVSVGTRPTLDKSPLTSEHSETPEDNDGDLVQDLAIGETVTYELVLTLPEYAMDSVVLRDTLPAGLTFIDAVITDIGNTVSIGGSTSLVDANGLAILSETGQTVTLTLADVLNSDNDGVGSRANDAIIVQITARVDDIVSNTGFAPNSQLTNTAGLTVTPQGEAALNEVIDTAIVELVEPNLTLEKTGTDAVNPGGTVDYQIVIENTGTGPAFDLIIADAFGDTNLTLVPDSVTFSFGGFTQADVAIVQTAGGFTFELNDTATGDPIPLQAGDILTVTYSAVLADDAPLAQSFVNTATVDYDSLPGDPVDENGNPVDDRDYNVEDSTTVATAPTLTKSPIASNFSETDSVAGSSPFDLAIGEEVTYTYTLSLPEIGMESVIFTDNLPTGMDFLSFDNVVFGTGLTDLAGGALAAPIFTSTGPNDFTLDFGAIANPAEEFPPTLGADDEITFTVTGRVNADRGAGDILTNTATLTVDPEGATPALETAIVTADVRVVEPGLSIDKTGPLALDPGDVGDFVITVGNTGPDVTPSATGPAYDIAIEDVLPAELILDPATIVVTLNGAPYTPAAGELTTTGNSFSLSIDVLLPDDEVQIFYSASLDPATGPLTSVINTATASYDGVPGDVVDITGNPVGKPYTPEVDEHRVSSQPTLTKTDIASGYSETPEDGDADGIRGVAIGETVTYELVLTLPETAMDQVVLTDLLPTGLQFVSASIANVGSEITINGTTDFSNSGQLLTVTINDLINAYVDGTITQGQDAIVVEVVARVANIDSNVEDVQLTNTAGLIVTPAGGSPLDELIDTRTVEIIEPSLTIEKSTPTLEPFLGDIVVYTVVISNESTATSPAFNSVITDALPGDLELTGVISLSDPSLGSVSPTSIAGATTLIINIPVLQPGESLIIEYEAFVGFTTNVLDPITNTATGVTSSSPVPGDPFGRDDIDQDTAIIVPLPTPTSDDQARTNAIDGIDDARFLRVLQIDPIFTGTAEPGANVTINLYNQMGGLDYVRNIVSDTGGHWIAIFPRVELDGVEDDFHEFHARSVLFDAPVKLIDQARTDSMNYANDARHLVIGSQLEDEAYTLGINVDRPSTLPQDAGIYNTRTFFAPANIGEIYGRQESVRVDEVFDNLAFNTVQELYQSSTDPLGISMNRFNYEFLSGSTAVPGQQ